MPQHDDGVVSVPVSSEGESMAQESAVDSGALAVAMTAMANEFGASAARRTQRADQTAADASAMWSIAMTTPTTNAALAFRTATESGSGQTRRETNDVREKGA